MKPDKFDIKIQEAVAQNEAAYDEKAWSAMEKLLNEKMPQKKKDNKKLFWWFLLLFIGISGFWLVMRLGENKKVARAPGKTNEANTIANGSDHILKNQKIKALSENVKSMPASQLKKSLSEKKSVINYPINHTGKKLISGGKVNSSRPNTITTNEKNSNSDAQSFDKKNSKEPINESATSNEKTQAGEPVAGKNIVAIANAKNNSIINNKYPDSSTKKNKDFINKNKFGKSFLISVSAGPDISAVSVNNPGKTELLYGAGIGYKINKRWTVRTGFYKVKKRYDAKSSEYNPPPGFWNYYPDLTSIDANCMIYEVPLIINYNLSQDVKHRWFVSAGISSYFMKKENYTYLSKSPSGQISYNNYSIRNKNQHYFSSLKLSAGYEKKVSDKISIIAEPYLNLPLSGIGYGKVKLYSAGILFSVYVKPFSKK